jgi:hypothetical protein
MQWWKKVSEFMGRSRGGPLANHQANVETDWPVKLRIKSSIVDVTERINGMSCIALVEVAAGGMIEGSAQCQGSDLRKVEGN